MAKEAVKIQEGAVVDYVCTADVVNGEVIVLPGQVGIAYDNAVTGETISLALEGVFEISAKTADDFVMGAPVFWDDAASEITKTGTAKAGIAVSTKAAATAGTILVKIG